MTDTNTILGTLRQLRQDLQEIEAQNIDLSSKFERKIDAYSKYSQQINDIVKELQTIKEEAQQNT
jgi:septation ring formation regulator EzrA